MIPKIIHYTWFSGDPFPKKIQECIDSWHRQMPDYEFILWDSNRIKEITSVWLSECLSKKKWAFAADFVRLYAVYHYGGIYLDTDCYLYKPFDIFLNDKCFIGKENSIHVLAHVTENHLSSHCFGAEKGNEYIGQCLSYYENRHFVQCENEKLPMPLKYCTLLLPFIQSEIAKQWNYQSSPLYDKKQDLGIMTIYPSCFFDVTRLTTNSYCKHLAVGAWRESAQYQEKVTLGYKIRWRIEFIIKRILRRFGYIMYRLN